MLAEMSGEMSQTGPATSFVTLLLPVNLEGRNQVEILLANRPEDAQDCKQTVQDTLEARYTRDRANP